MTFVTKHIPPRSQRPATTDTSRHFLRERTTQAKYDERNAFIKRREPRGGNRKQARDIFPWLDSRPDLIVAIDILEEDDKQFFGRVT